MSLQGRRFKHNGVTHDIWFYTQTTTPKFWFSGQSLVQLFENVHDIDNCLLSKVPKDMKIEYEYLPMSIKFASFSLMHNSNCYLSEEGLDTYLSEMTEEMYQNSYSGSHYNH